MFGAVLLVFYCCLYIAKKPAYFDLEVCIVMTICCMWQSRDHSLTCVYHITLYIQLKYIYIPPIKHFWHVCVYFCSCNTDSIGIAWLPNDHGNQDAWWLTDSLLFSHYIVILCVKSKTIVWMFMKNWQCMETLVWIELKILQWRFNKFVCVAMCCISVEMW